MFIPRIIVVVLSSMLFINAYGFDMKSSLSSIYISEPIPFDKELNCWRFIIYVFDNNNNNTGFEQRIQIESKDSCLIYNSTCYNLQWKLQDSYIYVSTDTGNCFPDIVSYKLSKDNDNLYTGFYTDYYIPVRPIEFTAKDYSELAAILHDNCNKIIDSNTSNPLFEIIERAKTFYLNPLPYK